MNLIVRSIPDPLLMSWISFETPNKKSFTNYPLYPSVDAQLVCDPTGLRIFEHDHYQ
jgi:hypothetical protein